MIAHEDRQAWYDLQVHTLLRLHPSWLAPLAAPLVIEARNSPLGRRWLANRLSAVCPVLLDIPRETGPASAPALGQATWLRNVLQNPLERALDLGSLALASTLRTMVTRSAVAQLRTLLGAERYQRILTAAEISRGNGPSPLEGASGHDLAERLARCGAAELASYATAVHPALGESVRLTFECSWWHPEPEAVLPPEVAERCLRLQCERAGGSRE